MRDIRNEIIAILENEYPAPTLAEISWRLNCHTSTVSKIVKALNEQGIINIDTNNRFKAPILAILQERPDLPSSSLAARVGCSIASADRVLKQLKDEGLLPDERTQRRRFMSKDYYSALKAMADKTECLDPDSVPYKVITLLAGDVKPNEVHKTLGVSRQWVNAAKNVAIETITINNLSYTEALEAEIAALKAQIEEMNNGRTKA